MLTLVTLGAACQAQGSFAVRGQNKAGEQDSKQAAASAPAEDISGMYSFLKEGEFVQINLEKTGMSGYISRMGDSESDRGVFLDQFFEKAQIQGHEVSFTTKPLHSVWYEFKGKFARGPAKTKVDDGYYVVRGTLKECWLDENKKTVSHSREVELKLLGQPDDSDQAATTAKSKKPKD
ncbi:MAG TPA: hypothetical protein VE133_03085 [Candidatus Sulfotelmatobacter sp.]|nr:hypothetical protein [Candidatus Sulfotelmatobacter sp.]